MPLLDLNGAENAIIRFHIFCSEANSAADKATVRHEDNHRQRELQGHILNVRENALGYGPVNNCML